MLKFRLTLALALLAAGVVLCFLHLYLWHDAFAALATMAGCLLAAELVNPGLAAAQAAKDAADDAQGD